MEKKFISGQKYPNRAGTYFATFLCYTTNGNTVWEFEGGKISDRLHNGKAWVDQHRDDDILYVAIITYTYLNMYMLYDASMPAMSAIIDTISLATRDAQKRKNTYVTTLIFTYHDGVRQKEVKNEYLLD